MPVCVVLFSLFIDLFSIFGAFPIPLTMRPVSDLVCLLIIIRRWVLTPPSGHQQHHSCAPTLFFSTLNPDLVFTGLVCLAYRCWAGFLFLKNKTKNKLSDADSARSSSKINTDFQNTSRVLRFLTGATCRVRLYFVHFVTKEKKESVTLPPGRRGALLVPSGVFTSPLTLYWRRRMQNVQLSGESLRATLSRRWRPSAAAGERSIGRNSGAESAADRAAGGARRLWRSWRSRSSAGGRRVFSFTTVTV